MSPRRTNGPSRERQRKRVQATVTVKKRTAHTVRQEEAALRRATSPAERGEKKKGIGGNAATPAEENAGSRLEPP